MIVFPREGSYIGTLLDDLCTKDSARTLPDADVAIRISAVAAIGQC
jgi:hypothetical protein